MDILFSSENIDVRIMDYDDIPCICKADNDESESNMVYLRNQLKNQKSKNVVHYWLCTMVR